MKLYSINLLGKNDPNLIDINMIDIGVNKSNKKNKPKNSNKEDSNKLDIYSKMMRDFSHKKDENESSFDAHNFNTRFNNNINFLKSTSKKEDKNIITEKLLSSSNSNEFYKNLFDIEKSIGNKKLLSNFY